MDSNSSTDTKKEKTSLVGIKDQKFVQVPTRQRIVNIIAEALVEEMQRIGLLDIQGKYIINNPYVTDLLKGKVKGIFDEPGIIGLKLGNELSFYTKVYQGHSEGGNLEIGGIKPEYREAPDFVVDKEIELTVFTE